MKLSVVGLTLFTLACSGSPKPATSVEPTPEPQVAAAAGEDCGTIAHIVCEDGLICARDGGFDVRGTCLDPASGPACGGFSNTPCPDSLTCHLDNQVDDGPGVCLSAT